MKETLTKNILWNEGARHGLLIGVFSGAFVFLNMLTSGLSENGHPFLAVTLNTTLWVIKFFGCLWLMRFAMLKVADKYKDVTSRSTFRLGVIIALTSALICAGIQLLNITMISQESMQTAIDSAMQEYSKIMAFSDSDRVAIDRLMGRIPQITFFTTLIYCFIYGTVASMIFSRSIPKNDIFADDNADAGENGKTE